MTLARNSLRRALAGALCATGIMLAGALRRSRIRHGR